MTYLMLGLQLILSLSILVILHELGHFLPAKKFGMRVEKFYLFFDPWFSIFKKKKGDTEYGVGWLPLGGYVKIAGMVDESMDKEQMAQPPQPWEFRSKPAWQRLIVMIGGVTVNLILGMFIYAMLLYAYGKEYIPVANAEYGVVVLDEIGFDAGFQDGDKIISINGKLPKDFKELNLEILLGSDPVVEIERNGQREKIAIPKGFAEKMVALNEPVLFLPAFPAVVDSIPSDSEAGKNGLMKGDQVIAVNDVPTPSFHRLQRTLASFKESDAKVTLLRGADTVVINTPISAAGTIGFRPVGPNEFLSVAVERYSFIESFPAGISEGFGTLVNYVKQFKVVFTKEGSQKLGGFGAIASQFDANWDWQRFWNITAFISIALAFMNILPIPALDGGHVVFLLYEMITGRKPSEKFLEKAQIIGMVLLLSLLIFANANDIIKAISGK
ncbi:MAG: RIP metalloprotease RseP [Flavobacteriales bacterium]